MPDLSDYGSPWLNVDAFERWAMEKLHGEARKGVTVTIEGTDFADMFDHKTRKKVSNPIMFLKGARRPLVLTGAMIESLAAVFGSYKSEDWHGKDVGMRIVREGGANGKDAIRAYPIVLDPKTRKAVEPLGERKAKLMIERMRALDLTFDGFLAAFKKIDRDRHDVLLGKEIADMPHWVLDEIKAWIERLKQDEME